MCSRRCIPESSGVVVALCSQALALDRLVSVWYSNVIVACTPLEAYVRLTTVRAWEASESVGSSFVAVVRSAVAC